MSNYYHYRVLILEDIPNLLQLYYGVLERAALTHGFPLTIERAKDLTEFKQLTDGQLFHFISLDQHIPEETGEERSVQTGAALTRSAISEIPFTRLVIYTGRTEHSNELLAISRDIKLPIWIKHTANEIIDGQQHYKPSGWAEAVIREFEGYPAFYFRQGEQKLPPGLAAHAREAALTFAGEGSALSASQKSQRVRAWCQFWEDSLRFMFVTAIALARHHNVPTSMPDYSGRAFENEKTIQRVFGAMTGSGAAHWWRKYLGTEKDCTFITQGSEIFRPMRNDFIHNSAGLRDWEKMGNAMRYIMDGAAFWGSYPLVGNLKQPDRQGRFSGDKFRSNAWPAEHFEAVLSPDVADPDPGRVYLLVENNDQGAELVDMWPWLTLEDDPESGDTYLAILTNCLGNPRTQSAQWTKRNLRTGKTSSWEPCDEARKRLFGEQA